MPLKGKYKTITEKDVSNEMWMQFTNDFENATVFHTPFIHNAYIGIKGYKPFAIFAIDENGTIVGMLSGYIQRMVPLLPSFLSCRGVITQTPLFANQDILDTLLGGYRRRYKLVTLYTEIRMHLDFCDNSHILAKHGFKQEDHLNIIVDLTKSEEELWKQVHSKRRNEIRKAQKNGLQVEDIKKHELSKAYGILIEVYARAKLPLMSKAFFQNLLDGSTPNCRLCIYGVYWEQKMIGTMFTLQFKGVIYDFYAGSKPEYYHLNPNDLIPWIVFMEGKRLGYKYFDFGGAGKPNVPYGVRDYKKKFGGAFVNYGRYKYTSYHLLYKVFEVAACSVLGKRI